jgi:hypothetical protein
MVINIYNDDDDNSKILQIDTNTSPKIKKSKSFNKISSQLNLIDLDDSTITIETTNDINLFNNINEININYFAKITI